MRDTTPDGLARGGVSRRTVVALGLLGLTSGLVGCGEATVDMPAEVPDSGLDEAREDFESAYDDARESWFSLQDSIESAQAADAEFQAGVVKNPDTLEAFEDALADAQAVQNEHDDYGDEPETSEELVEATERLEAASDDYEAAARKLADAQRAVELRQPGEGSFTYTDWDGYTYRIDYDLNPAITVDSTEGKPGQVGLYFDFTDCSVTLTNTTPGKKAPGMAFSLIPLYNVSDFSDFIILDDGGSLKYEVATFGPLSQPVTLEDESALGDMREYAYETRYLNPFDYESECNPDYGEVFCQSFSALTASKVSGGTMYNAGDDLEVGEAREMICQFGSSHNTISVQKQVVGNISEGYVDKFKNIAGWAIYPMGNTRAPKGTVVFAGTTIMNYWDGMRLYSYDPVSG
ncbi:hypothetical protein [Olsenella sp. An290]|uniref:hypothetical protein n=1 Tax=Olsenella sp. An290 TaxID=1965625 RepID=UPI0011811F06|nr:hypothetical protein [Olsenella sp. An290]